MKTLGSLPVGALIKDTATRYNGETIIWRVLGHNHDGDGTTTLEARDILTLKAFDAKEPNASDYNRRNYGNNNYKLSNILQFLNSDEDSWYQSKHVYDQAPEVNYVDNNYNPYKSEKGFLRNFSRELKTALRTVSKTTVKNTVTDGGGSETVSSKLFLLSTTEVGLSNENGIAEGKIYDYYKENNSNQRRQKRLATERAKGNYSASNPWYWWLRTPDSGYSNRVRHVNAGGSLNNYHANYGGCGISPAFVLLSSQSISSRPDSSGVYTIEWNQPPEISGIESEHLGDKHSGFTLNFSFSDADDSALTATVKLDNNIEKMISNVVQDQQYSYEITTEKLKSLTTTSHTIKIEVSDTKGTTTEKNIKFNRIASHVSITGANKNLGNIWVKPSITYQVSDSLGTEVSVEEKLNENTVHQENNVALNENRTFHIDNFDSLPDESTNTIKIIARNSEGHSDTKVITFTKYADRIVFQTDAVETDEAARRINVILHTKGGCNTRIEVTNNALAAEPTWEDATAKFLESRAYDFVNKPTENFGVAVKVTCNKTGTTERIYVNALGFSFS